MLAVQRVRTTLSVAGALAAVVLVGCAEPKPVAPPYTPPPVALSPKVIEQAAAYRYYMNRVTQISPSFPDGESIAKAVRDGAAYEPEQFLRGAIAYGAVVALQDPAFVAAVRTFAANPEQRTQVAYAIMSDPAYVVGINGSASAAGLVETALGVEGSKLYEQGKLVKQAAYDVQKAKWSKAEVVGRPERLAQAKALSAVPVVGDVEETLRLQQAAIGAQPLGVVAEPASPPYTPVVVRGLAVAALAALGYADDANLAQVMPVMTDPSSKMCINMSKLNLYQCLAVSKPHYEDVFCLGQHVMIDTGQCVMKSAGLPIPVDPRAFVPRSDIAAYVPTTKTAAAGSTGSAKPAPKKR